VRLAIIIPTLNEEANLEAALRSARQATDLIVVADGGSDDRTLEMARGAGTRVVVSAGGRGVQLDAGAQEAISAGADALLFLHADTVLPTNARECVTDAFESGHVGGGFSVQFDDPRLRFRLGSTIVNLRTRLSRLPLGDQAQFTSVTVYCAVGGFAGWPILEDLDFAIRLRRQGRMRIVADPVTTAARRFTERGILRTIATNWLIWLLYFAGVEPARLARLYPRREAQAGVGVDQDARKPCDTRPQGFR